MCITYACAYLPLSSACLPLISRPCMDSHESVYRGSAYACLRQQRCRCVDDCLSLRWWCMKDFARGCSSMAGSQQRG